MNSPGHRANILDPDHTHVGIGFAYNPETGYFYVAQEFLNRYVTIDYLPDYGKKGQVISFSGSLLLDATDPLLNIAYEPFPSLMTNEMLDQTSTYSSAAEFQESYLPTILTDDTFTFEFQLGEDLGFYHIRIWVEKDGEMIPAVNDIVLVT